MKSSWNIGEGARGEFRELIAFDRIEIDNPDPRDRVRLHYLNRVNKVLYVVRKYFPIASSARIGEFGCNQANLGLLLAEAGYIVAAVDINPVALRYAQGKYEHGSIEWVEANIETFEFEQESFDAIVLGENLTLFAHPEKLLARTLRFLSAGGLLIVTIPNGSLMGWKLPALRQMREEKREAELIAKQYGNAHLYKLTLSDLTAMCPPGARTAEAGYCGGSILLNKYTQPLARAIPVPVLEEGLKLLRRVPAANSRTLTTLYAVFQKT